MPLQSGDKGVRAIASYSSSGSLTSTQLNIVVCRPLLYVPFMTANSYTERDAVLQLPNLPQLYPGTAMQWLLMTNSTTSGVVNGAVTYAEN